MKTQRRPQRMFEHHIEAALWQLVSSSLPANLATRFTVGSVAAAPAGELLSALTARRAFPFMTPLPHPEPLHRCTSEQRRTNKYNPQSLRLQRCTACTLTGPNGGRETVTAKISFHSQLGGDLRQENPHKPQLNLFKFSYAYRRTDTIRGLKLMSGKCGDTDAAGAWKGDGG